MDVYFIYYFVFIYYVVYLYDLLFSSIFRVAFKHLLRVNQLMLTKKDEITAEVFGDSRLYQDFLSKGKEC